MDKNNTPPDDLLSNEEYHRIHVMEPDEYSKLREDLKEEYERTHMWHFNQRVGNTHQSIDGLIIDGIPARKFNHYRQDMKSQTPEPSSTSPYAPPPDRDLFSNGST